MGLVPMSPNTRPRDFRVPLNGEILEFLSGINEVSKVAAVVGDVLLGILPLEEFQKTLEEKMGLESDIQVETKTSGCGSL